MKMKVKNHCIITGTGRAGTTFLVQLLTYLGKDTGFSTDNLKLHEHARAGLEWDIQKPNSPYIVKNPWLCDTIGDVINNKSIVIDHAIIPYRDLQAAAESRNHVENITPKNPCQNTVPGGLWHTNFPQKQKEILAEQFYKLITVLGESEIPMTFIRYPRLTNDAEYLYDKLKFLMEGVSLGAFAHMFQKIVRPDWVHTFSPNDL